MRIKNKNQYQAILFLGAVLMTLQVFTIENRFFWKLFYGFNEHQRKIKRKLSPGYATKFSDICDLESKDTNVPFKQIMKQQRRKLSEKPDDIECEWTMAVPFDRADLDNIHGILLPFDELISSAVMFYQSCQLVMSCFCKQGWRKLTQIREIGRLIVSLQTPTLSAATLLSTVFFKVLLANSFFWSSPSMIDYLVNQLFLEETCLTSFT